MNLEYFANPLRMQKLSKIMLPYMILGMLICFTIGFYYGLFNSPPDYQQKETVRIMYIHVPAAWFSLGIFLSMGICSFFVLWRKHHVAHIASYAMAPVGMIFSIICLVTGSLWGRPTWGTYWIWDARLTSMLILFFLYVAYLLLPAFCKKTDLLMKVAAIFCLVGVIDIPIIKFSVEWWNTLHQGPSVIKSGGPSIHHAMLTPLLWMAAGYAHLAGMLILLGIRTRLYQQKIDRMIYKKIRNYT